jgi:hypothetical protein
MSDSDSTTTDTGADIGDVIDQVEDCIQRLELAEEAAHMQFKAPEADELERAALWAKHGISARYPNEQLERLLQGLAGEMREMRWFQWLTWVFFGEPTEGR